MDLGNSFLLVKFRKVVSTLGEHSRLLYVLIMSFYRINCNVTFKKTAFGWSCTQMLSRSEVKSQTERIHTFPFNIPATALNK